MYGLATCQSCKIAWMANEGTNRAIVCIHVHRYFFQLAKPVTFYGGWHAAPTYMYTTNYRYSSGSDCLGVYGTQEPV